CHQYNNWNTF
nr:immunoglobulin light chain junction region [Macaca mulatta]MOX47663.1 immunoglobulin light chain junction region [Macaca mulatta]MOX47664.1 immunoglobulin light chain junction region [Macaca mulatta]MOX47763.1 immunoglobulin light chain junction region [Macaca mulatta]MOX47820.1 immunoglobulin light chain junction region [Macaca mulatta]